MQLTGKQIAQICDALVDAFDKATLRRLVRLELGQKLEAVADGENLSVLVFNLVNWAEQQGRIEELIVGAHRQNSGNAVVKQLFQDSRAWPTAEPAPTSAVPRPASVQPAPIPAAAAKAPIRASIDIFLSYSRQDAAAMRAVQDALRAAGLSVWTDEGLEPGTPSWAAAIQEAIEQAETFVVLLSPAAKASKWVNNEIEYAQVYKKPLYPVLITSDEATSVPISLISAQWIDGRRDPAAATAQRLLPKLKVLEAPAPSASSGSPQPPIILYEQRPAHSSDRLMVAHNLKGHTNYVNSVAFHPDGGTLATCGDDNTVRLWSVRTGQQLRMLMGPISWANLFWRGSTGRINSVAFNPDGNTFVVGNFEGVVQLRDARTGKRLRTLKRPGFGFTSVAFSPDGGTFASSGWSNPVWLWDARTGEQMQILEGVSAISMMFSPDSSMLATASLYDNNVQLWDTQTGKQRRILEGHTSQVNCVAFSPDGSLLASGSNDSTIRLWVVSIGRELQKLEGYTSTTSFQLPSSIPIFRELQELEGYTSAVNSVAFSPDGRLLASGNSNNTVQLWDVETGKLLQTRQTHTKSVNEVAFSPDGNKLASVSDDRTVRLWNVQS